MRYHCPAPPLLSLFAVAGALAAFHGAAAAQTTTGSIRGYVTNAAGAPLPNAQIEAHDTTTSVRRGAVAGSNGFYTLAGLTPGYYVVTARRIGSAPRSVPVRVGVGQDLTLSFQLSDTAAQLQEVTVP